VTDLDLVVEAPRAVVGGVESGCSVGVRDGRIAAVEAYGAGLDAARVVRLADDEVLLPGLVDTHVHVNDPGRSEWEGFEHATRAAAAGGVTTLLDMPLNSIPATLDVAALEAKRSAASGHCHVDVGLWGGAVPANRADLEPLWDAGVFGFKGFLVESGVPEFPALGMPDLVETMLTVASFGGLLLVHAEDPHTLGERDPDSTRYEDFLRSRPHLSELSAVTDVVDAVRRSGCRTHVVHVSTAQALPVLATARASGVPVTAETCPHYLTFVAEEVPDGATEFACCPPIRERANRELLWQGLADGTIGCVVSDHSPCPARLKHRDTGRFADAWGGISSVQLGLPAVWTQARRRGHRLTDVVRWMAAGPAARAGLARKGSIAVGRDADLCVFAPDESFVVEPGRLQHRHPLTPYAGRRLTGVVRQTWLAGRRVDITAAPHGRLLTRGGTA
jgi:allantoinase